MFLWSLYIPDNKREMSNGYDDCAVCRAWTKKQAILVFRKMYNAFQEDAVQRVKYNQLGIAVISNY